MQAPVKTPREHDPEKLQLSMENGLPRYRHKEMTSVNLGGTA
jgi:hypothetical protein